MESYSQIGQDLWVQETLKNKKNGYFLDIGAHDGLYLSNTYLLERNYDWDGLCIEGNPLIIDSLKQNRKCVCVEELLSGREEQVNFLVYEKDKGVFSKIVSDNDVEIIKKQVKNPNIISRRTSVIKDVLVKNNVPKIIDYMSLDVEGKEVDILNSFPFNDYKVKCITVEHNEPHEGSMRRNIIRNVLTNNGYKFIKGNDDINNWGHGPIDDYYIFDNDNKNTKKDIKKNDNIKIGILIKKFSSLFTCGISQQSYFTYKVLKKAGFNVELITAEDDYTEFEYMNIPIRKLTFQSDISDLSMMLFISSSVSSRKELEFIRSFNIKIVNQICGNYYYITQEDIVHDCHKRDFYLNGDLIDEYWILPMYDHMKSYIEAMTKRPVYIMNYVWDGDIIEKYMEITNNNANNFFRDSNNIFNNSLNLLIAEPNLSIHKTALIPMAISEKYDYDTNNIERVYLLCKNKNESFKRIFNAMDIVKKGKVEMHHRVILMEVLFQLREKKIPIALLSHQIKNDLNFIHLEMIYLGYPVIHNCERLKDNGLFYNEHNVEEGINILNKCKVNYKLRDNKDILERYDTYNSKNVEQYRNTINRIFNKENKVLIEEIPETKLNNNYLLKTDEISTHLKDFKVTNYKKDNKNINKDNKYINKTVNLNKELTSKVFNNIYKNSDKIWTSNNNESVSGPGSTLENTAYTRHELKNIIRKYNIKNILDFGCGDFNWMKEFIDINDKYIESYTGIDIVSDIIKNNNEKYSNKKIKFLTNKEFSEITNNKYDLVICKEVMIHLPFTESLDLIKLFKEKCEYFLGTTFKNIENTNINTGQVYNINLFKEPFNFCEPAHLIDERGTLMRFDNNLREIPQYMGLWKCSDI
jgi:FkbM family methyltransferase